MNQCRVNKHLPLPFTPFMSLPPSPSTSPLWVPCSSYLPSFPPSLPLHEFPCSPLLSLLLPLPVLICSSLLPCPLIQFSPSTPTPTLSSVLCSPLPPPVLPSSCPHVHCYNRQTHGLQRTRDAIVFITALKESVALKMKSSTTNDEDPAEFESRAAI